MRERERKKKIDTQHYPVSFENLHNVPETRSWRKNKIKTILCDDASENANSDERKKKEESLSFFHTRIGSHRNKFPSWAEQIFGIYCIWILLSVTEQLFVALKCKKHSDLMHTLDVENTASQKNK